jgi:hypothetical protein
MIVSSSKRLFHALVVSGVAITSASAGCGGAARGSSPEAGDASAQPSSDFPDGRSPAGNEDAAATPTPDAAIAFADAAIAPAPDAANPPADAANPPADAAIEAARDAALGLDAPYGNIAPLCPPTGLCGVGADAGSAFFDAPYAIIFPPCAPPACPALVDAQASQDAAEDAGPSYVGIR